MNYVWKKKIFAIVSFLHITGCFASVLQQLDKDLDPSRAVILAEKEVRLLEQDLNGSRHVIPEDDMILLLVMVREHLNMMPYGDLYSNPYFVRAETGKVMAQFVAKRAQQHASAITNNSQRIANAAKIESNEFMSLLSNNPLRNGQSVYHYFGETFEKRVKENIMNGRKY